MATNLKILPAMAEIMAALDVLPKSKQTEPAPGQRAYAYRGIDDLLGKLHPALIAAKVLIRPRLASPPVLEYREGRGNCFRCMVSVEYAFVSLEDGSEFISGPFVGEGCDSGDKAANKAHTAAFKNAMYQTFCVPVEGGSEDSEDGEQDEPKTPGKKAAKKTSEAKTKEPAAPEETEAQKDSRHRVEIWDAALKLNDGIEEAAIGQVQKWSEFMGDEKDSDGKKTGKKVPISCNSLKKLSGKWLNTTLDWCRKEMEASADETQTPEPEPPDSEIPF